MAQKSTELEQYLQRVQELEDMYHKLEEALEEERRARQDEETVRKLQGRSVRRWRAEIERKYPHRKNKGLLSFSTVKLGQDINITRKLLMSNSQKAFRVQIASLFFTGVSPGHLFVFATEPLRFLSCPSFLSADISFPLSRRLSASLCS